jgi:membrane protein YqaA with SNARE-associated domain
VLEVHAGLFVSALLSATLLPGSSELLISSLAAQGYPLAGLWLWATLGNTLGSAVNALLGRGFLRFRERRWFPFRAADLERGHRWFARYGKWSLLLAWAPLFGDALTLVAGVLRVSWWEFLLLVGIGKGLRYALVLGMVGLLV